jgi:GNAT superfamily N-acetyltransferase
VIEIRKAKEEDKPEIWKIIKAVISTGDTYTIAPDAPEEEVMSWWFGSDKHTYTALSGGGIVGTFFLKANQPGLGAHVGNAGYMVSPDARGKGVGRYIAEWSLDEARRLGFSAMQFNFVVKSNEGAVRLWQKLGFEVIGEIPEAFDHSQLGLTNAFIMYRKL